MEAIRLPCRHGNDTLAGYVDCNFVACRGFDCSQAPMQIITAGTQQMQHGSFLGRLQVVHAEFCRITNRFSVPTCIAVVLCSPLVQKGTKARAAAMEDRTAAMI